MKIEFQSVVWTSLVFVLVLLSIFPVALLQLKAESQTKGGYRRPSIRGSELREVNSQN